ncbi:MAG: D-glycero-beta-D-manno-heptose 1,7-bisphosphate 7-phosphatase [Candidatus Diapherotrites archaeon]|uniref:D,D-heptose 1,7-bisphosphate phosphatase n=1 Tax=Candidatus Iainarchaeum sp. TaxID=3101447 RepID=A0A8T4KRY9_9ARCH|nr:D-glycero-beta-D-manno-heptose 1,7-bisphosphate 7-phosphatase [Candidatus Diapherotrites archaeon]
MNCAVFLDRDGTINYDYGYVHEIKKFRFLPNAASALKRLSSSKYKIIVITNQSGIGRKYFTEQDFLKVSGHMVGELHKKDVRIDAIYCCPHAPDANCTCRKPKTAMLFSAKKDFNIALNKSFVIGDKLEDIEMGKKAGCKTMLITNGVKEKNSNANFNAKDLLEAAKYILDVKA